MSMPGHTPGTHAQTISHAARDLFDGCASVEEMADTLSGQAQYLRELAEDGYRIGAHHGSCIDLRVPEERESSGGMDELKSCYS